MIINDTRHPGSFRDESGLVFSRGNRILRQVNQQYKEHYDWLLTSGLYKHLIDSKLLIPHTEAEEPPIEPASSYKIILPYQLPFISYPYEWCFGQLKDAAKAVLSILKKSLEYGMILKDASAYNIQFLDGKPCLIDTLSFERYSGNEPWVAYRQFCQHFLVPLALMSYRDPRLGQLLRIFIDGIPLDLASLLLPMRTYGSFSIITHIHLHAKSQIYFSNSKIKANSFKMNKVSLRGLIDNLESAVNKLKLKHSKSAWADYYKITNYSKDGFAQKKSIVNEFIERIKPSTVWDMGSNIGEFSKIASSKNIFTVSFDSDAAAVERNYLDAKKNKDKFLLPLVIDLTNPSSNIGWHHKERMSLADRGPADAALALALTHHLFFTGNIKFRNMAEFFSGISRWLIIEFIPLNDSQVSKLTASRNDDFSNYTQASFEENLRCHFEIKESAALKDSGRIIYLMKNKTLL